MKKASIAAIVIAGATTAPAATYAAEKKELHGWGPLKFGMTREEASNALNGRIEAISGDFTVFTAKILEKPCVVYLHFGGPNETLNEIDLTHNTNSNDEDECPRTYKYFEPDIKNKYGFSNFSFSTEDQRLKTHTYIFANGTITYGASMLSGVCIFSIYYKSAQTPKKATF